MATLSKAEKLCGVLGILCFLLLNYPLIHIFNYDTLVAGFPILPLYILLIWILAIIALYALSSRMASPDPEGQQESQDYAE